MVVRSFGNALAGFKDIFGKTGNRASKEYVVAFSATGGNVDALAPGNGYKYHTFTSPGTFTVSGQSGIIEVLIVAGGGGGGNGGGGTGGGGGAGGVRYYPSLPVSIGPYSITVGAAGDGASAYNIPGTRGGNSTAFGKTASGGGHINYSYPTLGPGGSGAGAYNFAPTVGTGNVGGNDPAASPISEGNDGAPGGNMGGGGAGAVGGTYNGGNGLQFPSFTGPLIGVPSLAPLSGYFGGGGAGGYNDGRGTGGLGGGGNGGSRTGNGVSPGTANSGGGGGGDSGAIGAGAPGGSGIVIIRYLA
jgi:hypothetical protein